MKMAVTHLTRMQRGYFCVAGVDVADGRSVRPVLPRGRLRDLYGARRGGPFDMALVVDLGRTRPVPAPPEVEDHEFTPDHARVVQRIEPLLFWEMLCHLAKTRLTDLFGPDLRPVGRDRAIVDQAVGSASLGCLAPTGRVSLAAEENQQGSTGLRLRFTDGRLSLNLSVTDQRLWADDHGTPRWERVRRVKGGLERGVPCLLSVGLTRPFSSKDDEPPVHWLQVNNIHLSDDPCWRLGDDLAASIRSSDARPPWRGDDDLEDLPF